MAGEHEHTQWLDFLRGHKGDIEDALIAGHIEHKKDFPESASTQAFDKLGGEIAAQKELPKVTGDVEEDDDEEEVHFGVDPESGDVMDTKGRNLSKQARRLDTVMKLKDGDNLGFALGISAQTLALVEECWWHYVHHECQAGSRVVDEFVERLLESMHRAMSRESDL